LRLEKTGFSCWKLMFAIFCKSCSSGTDNIFFFYLTTRNRNADKTTWDCKTELNSL